MIKAYIVDDEPLARDELKYLLLMTKKVELVGEAEHIEQALRGIHTSQPDVVFLDIQLSNESGLELASLLLESGAPQPAIVFATAYDEYALKAFELNAIDYLLKPFDERRIRQTVDKLANRIERALSVAPRAEEARAMLRMADQAVPDRSNRLAVTVDDRIVLIHIDQMLYIGYEDGKSVIVTVDRRYKVNEALSVLERRIHYPSMMRVHRAYIVNVDRIVEIEPWFNSTCQLRMQDGVLIPVSRTYMKELKQTIGF